MGQSPERMTTAIIANLRAKTGRSLEEWVDIVKSGGPVSFKERVLWLKSTHGLGHVQAQVVAWEADKGEDFVPATPQELLEAQYAGPGAALRPIYDGLARALASLGDDVLLDPRKTYVSAIRRRQFAVIQPSTRSRIDLGLVLPGVPHTDRLRPAPSSLGSERVTHAVALTSPGDVDDELVAWIRAAYDGDGSK